MSSNFLIMRKNTCEHYFYRKGAGICVRTRENDAFTRASVVYAEGAEEFSVFADAAGSVHIICTNPANEIVYLTEARGDWSRYIVSSADAGIVPMKFMTVSNGSRLNVFYSAIRKNEPVLIFCVLGAPAKPEIVDTLHPAKKEFFIFKKRVYYTNAADILGFRSFAAGKMGEFVSVADNAGSAYLLEHEDKFLITYKRRHTIYFENLPVFEDFAAELPTLLISGSRLILQWKSGSFVRYISSFNMGKSWSTPMRFVSPGRGAELFNVQSGCGIRRYYGSATADNVTLFAEPNIFPKPNERLAAAPEVPTDISAMELKKLKILIDMTANDVSELKKRMKSIEGRIEELTKGREQAET